MKVSRYCFFALFFSVSILATRGFGQTAPSLVSPSNGATILPQAAQFSWTPVSGAMAYAVWIGSTQGADDVLYYSTDSTNNPGGTTSTTLTLPPGGSYYARVWAKTAAGFTYSDSVFQTSPTPYLLAPANGATIPPQAQFSWTPVPGALAYAVWIGSTPGGQDVLYYSTDSTNNPGGTTSTTLTLPPGGSYYARVWAKTAAGFTYSDSVFQTSPTPYLLAPANGATIPPQAQFSWTPVPGALAYAVWIGSTPGGQDVLYYSTDSTNNPGGTTSTTLTLPPGGSYYARVWAKTAAGFTYSDSVFQTSPTPYLLAPANGATIPPQAQFSWTPVPGALAYAVWIGSTPGGQDVLYYSTDSTNNPGGTTSTTLTLPPGGSYYARVWAKTAAGFTYSDSVLQTSATPYLLTPARGTTVSPQSQFSWTPVPGATSYALWIGTSPGSQNVLYYSTTSSSNPGGTTSATLTLPPAGTYYARIWARTSTGFTYSDSIFQTSATSHLTSPGNGTVVSPQIQFAWVPISGAISYALWIGSSPGAQDVLNYSTSSATSTSANLQPSTTYYARLWTQTAAGYTYSDSVFQTNGSAVLLSPANGSANLDAGAPVTFNWTPVSNTTWYELYLGSSVGARDYYDSGGLTTVSTTLTLKPNTTYYARLWTDVGGQWRYTDTSFSTGYSLAHLTYPLNGATNVSPFHPFSWSVPQGATGYNLSVSPTGYGVPDFFVGIQYMIASVSSSYVWGLEPNTKYYVQLCTQNPGPYGGGCVNTTFTTGDAPPLPADRNAFFQTVQNLTSQVRLMAQFYPAIPVPGSFLYQFIQNHAADPTQATSCGWFAAALLDQFTMNGILARQRNLSLDGADGHVLTEYWDPFNQKWEVADPTFGVVYFDPNAQVGQGADEIESNLLAGNLSAITPLFLTSYNSQYAKTYYMDPITLYANVMPFGMLVAQDELNYVPNSPLPFLTDVTATASGAGIYIFSFSNATDSITIQNGSGLVTVSPVNKEGWATSVYLNPGWSITSAIPGGMHIYQFKRVMF